MATSPSDCCWSTDLPQCLAGQSREAVVLSCFFWVIACFPESPHLPPPPHTHTFHVRKLTRRTICPGVPLKNGCSMTLLPQHCLTQSSLYNSLRMHIYIIRKTLALCAPIDLSYVNTNRCVFNLSSQVILSYQTFGFTESSAVGSSG